MYLYSRDSFHHKWGSVDDDGGMGGCSKQGVDALCVSVLLLPVVNFPFLAQHCSSQRHVRAYL